MGHNTVLILKADKIIELAEAKMEEKFLLFYRSSV